jgi:hypothetical protein
MMDLRCRKKKLWFVTVSFSAPETITAVFCTAMLTVLGGIYDRRKRVFCTKNGGLV